MDTNKILLVVAIAALSLGCIVGLAVTDAESDAASSSDVITKHPAVSGEKGAYTVQSKSIKITEASLQDDIITNVGVWHYWTGSDALRVTEALKTTPSTGPGTNNPLEIPEVIAEEEKSTTATLKMSITQKSTEKTVQTEGGSEKQVIPEPGFFTLSFTNVNKTYDGSKLTFNIAYQITSTSGKNTSLVQTLYYQIIVEASKDITVLDGGNNNSADFKLGVKLVPHQLIVSGDTITGTWYATNLPAGLAMNSKGQIVGVPAQLTEAVTVNVYVTDFSGTIHHGTYTVSVSGNSQLKITSVSENVKYAGQASLDKKSMDRYMMYTKGIGTFTFTLEHPDGTLKVKMVDSKGEVTHTDVKKVESQTNSYTFDVNPQGTGDYTVIIEDNHNKAMFCVYAINKVQDVQADIFFDLHSA